MSTMHNPYWDEVQKFPGDKFEQEYYPELCGKYAWSIPDPDSLVFAAKHLAPRAVEIGAGTGYWASLLTQMGVNMLCFDLNPPQHTGQNVYHSPRDEKRTALLGVTREIFFNVYAGNHLMAAQHPDRTLLLSWPPNDEEMAYHTLQAYTGNKLVYIGESEGGRTGDDAFFALLDEQWERIDSHVPVQWSGIHDVIEVYVRKHSTTLSYDQEAVLVAESEAAV